jgi:uncharacterized protein (TIGR03437 family)
MARTLTLRPELLLASLLAAAPAAAQSVSPVATPVSLNFSYQVNSAVLPSSQTVQVAVPTALAASVLSVQYPMGWLTVTPDTGRAPLALTVNVNPTGLAPGSYAGAIVISSSAAGSGTTTVTVTLLITTPPASLAVSSQSTNYTASPASLVFTYITGQTLPAPASSTLEISSTGDTIPFNVAASAGSGSASAAASSSWLKVNSTGQTPSAKTSGVALSGSFVPIVVSLDPVILATLNPGSYTGSVAVAASSSVNGSATIAVSLVVSAGPPTLHATTPIFPNSLVAGPAVNPVITIYGDNFFSTSVVTLQPALASTPPLTLTSTLLSRKVLRAVIPAAQLASPGIWKIAVANPAPANAPGQSPVSTILTVVSATQPLITSVVNAASYLPTATQTGTNPNPAPANATSISPRQIISLFGQNLGPSTPTTASATGSPAAFPATLSGIDVVFQFGAQRIAAPLTMVSANQVNAIVPLEAAAAIGTGATITLTNRSGATAVSTPAFAVTVVEADPGIFTFGGLGKGQAAVLNFDSTTSAYTINSSKDGAARSSTILIYATGMGNLGGALVNGEIATTAVSLASNTTRVEIDGQAAVVSYAGTSPGAVAGVVQINAVVPPTVKTGQAVPITVSIGTAATARRSQAQVTIGVK